MYIKFLIKKQLFSSNILIYPSGYYEIMTTLPNYKLDRQKFLISLHKNIFRISSSNLFVFNTYFSSEKNNQLFLCQQTLIGSLDISMALQSYQSPLSISFKTIVYIILTYILDILHYIYLLTSNFSFCNGYVKCGSCEDHDSFEMRIHYLVSRICYNTPGRN